MSLADALDAAYGDHPDAVRVGLARILASQIDDRPNKSRYLTAALRGLLADLDAARSEPPAAPRADAPPTELEHLRARFGPHAFGRPHLRPVD